MSRSIPRRRSRAHGKGLTRACLSPATTCSPGAPTSTRRTASERCRPNSGGCPGLRLAATPTRRASLRAWAHSLLDLVKQTAGTEEEYLDAFWAVNAQLKAAQDAAGAQVSAADKQLEALQGQLDVQNAALTELQGQSATLEEIEKQIADLRPLLDAAGREGRGEGVRPGRACHAGVGGGGRGRAGTCELLAAGARLHGGGYGGAVPQRDASGG